MLYYLSIPESDECCMPKRAVMPSVADDQAAPGGSAGVDRALSLLSAFTPAEPSLTLSQLAERCRLYKSTVLRLLASLEHARLVLRHANRRYTLGPEVARMNAVYTASFSLEAVVMPVLQDLTRATLESAAFHVRQGDMRLCLYRVDSPHTVRDHARAGDMMPLDRGAGARVLQAFSGAQGPIFDRIRRDRVVVIKGDRVPEVAGISAPAFNAAGALAGALTLTMPVHRLNPAHATDVVACAQRITTMLGGHSPDPGNA